jgi:hypothetical protein
MKRTPESFPQYADPLTYSVPEVDISDWHDVPAVAVETLLHLQHHHKTVVQHLSKSNENETTENLRKGLEERMDVSINLTFNQFCV